MKMKFPYNDHTETISKEKLIEIGKPIMNGGLQ